MGLVTGLLKMFFGTKSDKDRREIEPYVNKIKEIYPQIEQLSNDELRAHSAALQAAIAAYIADDEAQITVYRRRSLEDGPPAVHRRRIHLAALSHGL